MVWMSPRSRLDSRLCSAIASRIGSGKKNTSWNAVIASVLRNASQKAGSSNSSWNCPKPIQSLCRNACHGLSPR